MIEGLHLNGNWLDHKSLLEHARERQVDVLTCEWENAFWSFLSEWFNDKDVISVQTSGSTGIPKTLEIQKHYFLNSARMTLDFLRIKPGDRALLCLSPAYIAGKMMIVRALIGELRLSVVSPQVSSIVNYNETSDFSAMVPTQVQTILSQPDGRERLAKIGILLIGGGPVSRDIEDHLQDFDNRIYATYGLTETVSHIGLRKINGSDRSPHYTTLPGVKISTDINHCLIIDAPDLAEKTLLTRDVVRLVGDNQFELVGRFDHVINSGSIKYHPEVIEGKLAPLIPDRFIISSMPDQRLGEKLILIIESAEYRKDKREKLELNLRTILPPYEVPKKILFLAYFSVVGNGKLSRKTITREALQANSIKVHED